MEDGAEVPGDDALLASEELAMMAAEAFAL
jgi:hypothetical protein